MHNITPLNEAGVQMEAVGEYILFQRFEGAGPLPNQGHSIQEVAQNFS